MGLDVVGQHLEPTRAVLACRVLEPDRWCHRCGCEGTLRDSVLRRLAHEPLGWRPTTLLVTIRRYQGPDHTLDREEPVVDCAPWTLDGLVVIGVVVREAVLHSARCRDVTKSLRAGHAIPPGISEPCWRPIFQAVRPRRSG